VTPEIRVLVQQVATNLALPEGLLVGQVEVESSADPSAFKYERDFFQRYIQPNPTAKGYRYGPLAASSYGLLQVMLETALELGFDGKPEDLFIPRVGLMWGAKYLQACWHSVGNTPQTYPSALCRYNGGLGNQPPFKNLAYAQRVYQIAQIPMPPTM
jgi:hypothetical protein